MDGGLTLKKFMAATTLHLELSRQSHQQMWCTRVNGNSAGLTFVKQSSLAQTQKTGTTPALFSLRFVIS